MKTIFYLFISPFLVHQYLCVDVATQLSYQNKKIATSVLQPGKKQEPKDSLDSKQLNNILSAKWTEIIRQGKVWMRDNHCGYTVPALSCHNDTIDLLFKDDHIESYLIRSKKKDHQKNRWELKSFNLVREDTLTIFVNRIDKDKTFWKFGAGTLNVFKFEFVNINTSQKYPRKIRKCD